MRFGKTSLLLSAAILLFAAASSAQNAPAVNNPLAGQPQTPAAMKLAPIAGSPIPTAADKLPVAKLKVPPGFKVELFAAGVANARSMTVGDKGTVFVGSRLVGNVYAIRTKDGKAEVKVIARGLQRPNGVAFHKGALYVSEISKISRIDKAEDNLDKPATLKVINDKFPTDEPHGWKFIAIGPDNKLYVPVGSPGNILMPDFQTHGHIRRMNLDGSGMEIVAQGIRNSVGFDWNPVNKDLYFTDNGRDWVSEDTPEDELNHVSATGKKHFGFPFCHQGNLRDPEFGWGVNCADYEPPVGLLGAHGAALGMRFYTGAMFPAEYKNAIFIVRHGAWNRTDKIGGDIVVAHLNPDGSMKSYEPFLTGCLEDNKYLCRPVDVQMMKDGSLLLSDDLNGAIYRISYAK